MLISLYRPLHSEMLFCKLEDLVKHNSELSTNKWLQWLLRIGSTIRPSRDAVRIPKSIGAKTIAKVNSRVCPSNEHRTSSRQFTNATPATKPPLKQIVTIISTPGKKRYQDSRKITTRWSSSTTASEDRRKRLGV